MSLASILSENSNLVLTPSNKIRCTLTSHEMPPRVDAVKSYLRSSKYKSALIWSKFNIEEVSPYIIQHRDHSHLLYCQITGATLNKIPEQIMKHVNGKKYLRRKREHEEGKHSIEILEIPGEEVEQEVEDDEEEEEDEDHGDDSSNSSGGFGDEDADEEEEEEAEEEEAEEEEEMKKKEQKKKKKTNKTENQKVEIQQEVSKKLDVSKKRRRLDDGEIFRTKGNQNKEKKNRNNGTKKMQG